MRYVALAVVMLLLGFGAARLFEGDVVPQAAATPHVVPTPGGVTRVPELPSETVVDLQIVKDVSVFDLRSWKPVHPDSTGYRTSPVNYTNFLEVRKTGPVGRAVIHYGTSGAAIDLRCVTHRCKIYERGGRGLHEAEREYAVELTFGPEVQDSVFIVVLEGTYWNGFRNPESSEALTYTGETTGLETLQLIVLLPNSKPFQGFSLWSIDDVTNASARYEHTDDLYRDPEAKLLSWAITDFKPHHHYKLEWSW